MISAAIFDHRPSGNFFKLFRTKEAAIDCALHHFTQNAVMAATELTLWFLLKLSFTDQQWLELMLSDEKTNAKIVHGPGKMWSEWHVSGRLCVEPVPKEWLQLTLAPIGYTGFAENQLWKRPSAAEATCEECNAEKTRVWLSSKRHAGRDVENHNAGYGQKAFCAECWCIYLMKKFVPSDADK